ncbi:hypothetical protein QYF48_19375 [Brevibacillus agri]|uniref:hypothetical protein n=1 Tax=Brevibacillus agri TaxID=51101 RepID=UPI0002A4F01E|nr:hypothetical protein [Brevibacillus agri]ELK40329.1 hypothetical protein D478_19639 [Brevibacillus agri BAB-2500]MBG9566620.1 hypothetical protein [Brevibacillus agri]MDN4094954.1 hypothetical protein [Brevibacillus agri]
MEDMLLLLSLEDFFALLALFVGCFTSAFCLRRCHRPQIQAFRWSSSDTYRPSINPCLVETYPMAARQPLRFRMLRRARHANGDKDTYRSLLDLDV